MEQYRFTDAEMSLLEHMPTPLAVYQFLDNTVVLIAISEGFCRLFGYTDVTQAYSNKGRDIYRHIHPDDMTRVANAAYRFATDRGDYDVFYRSLDHARRHADDGDRAAGAGTAQESGEDENAYRIVHARAEHVFTETGERLAYVWYTDEGPCTDDVALTSGERNQKMNRVLYEESINNVGRYDLLTGLPTMTYFFELWDTARDEMLHSGEHPVMLYMDLSGMKFFNTQHGFEEGDALLCAFARLLAKSFGSERSSRIGSDHFVAVTREEGLQARLDRFIEECAKLNGGVTLPVHIGAYPKTIEDVSASTACDRAKIACDSLKATYGSACSYYSKDLLEYVVLRQHILTSFDQALEERWIQVYYQPIVRALNRVVCDDEALARWIDPVHGFIAPNVFIPILEEAGLVYRLDLFVLDRVLDKIRMLEETGRFLVPQSVNLSRSDFDSCDIVEEIRKRVDAAGISRSLITIEITETTLSQDFEFMKTQVERFQELGFAVWMDDFGSGYSSLEVLQTISFDLIKFDMSFLRRLDEGSGGRIIMTELVRMANALGSDTLCEGVETEDQVKFLQEIGCAKLQGYYFCKPGSLETLIEWNSQPGAIGYENPMESDYYERIGRVNLYDLEVIANEGESEGTEGEALRSFFATLPMGIIEVRGEMTRFARSNQSYRSFIKRFFGFDLSIEGTDFAPYDATFMNNIVETCCMRGLRSFYDEKMPDGSIVHSFARRVGINPLNGDIAVAIVVLSITNAKEGANYADIARALAADYYTLYYVDLETEDFIEYSSSVGVEEVSVEHRGEDFFDTAQKGALERIYAPDRPFFLEGFTKENIQAQLDKQGVFTMTYRLLDSGKPMYVNMKAMRMAPDGKRLIIGISDVDSQMRQREEEEQLRRDRVAAGRVAALVGNYLSLYTVDPKTGAYSTYNQTETFAELGYSMGGKDFFKDTAEDGKWAVWPEDLPYFLEKLTRENMLRTIKEHGVLTMHYRVLVEDEPVPVELRAALVREGDDEKIIIGVSWENE